MPLMSPGILTSFWSLMLLNMKSALFSFFFFGGGVSTSFFGFITGIMSSSRGGCPSWITHLSKLDDVCHLLESSLGGVNEKRIPSPPRLCEVEFDP